MGRESEVENGKLIQGEKEVGERWRSYFSVLLRGRRVTGEEGGVRNDEEVVNGEEERSISREEMEVAV